MFSKMPKGVGKNADTWAAGLMATRLLTEYFPFDDVLSAPPPPTTCDFTQISHMTPHCAFLALALLALGGAMCFPSLQW